MKYLLIIIFAIAITGCQRQTDWEKGNQSAKETVSDVIYIKDTRTGLCFALLDNASSYGHKGLATVPCDKIMDHLSGVGRWE